MTSHIDHRSSVSSDSNSTIQILKNLRDPTLWKQNTSLHQVQTFEMTVKNFKEHSCIPLSISVSNHRTYMPLLRLEHSYPKHGYLNTSGEKLGINILLHLTDTQISQNQIWNSNCLKIQRAHTLNQDSWIQKTKASEQRLNTSETSNLAYRTLNNLGQTLSTHILEKYRDLIQWM